ncbi:MAG TPA: sulfotransferase [Chloroflexi bacterium]|nr:sulfotransferase [Chloroflexota bacterium]
MPQRLVRSIGSRLRVLPDLSPRQVYHRLRYRLSGRERLSTFDEEHPCIFALSTGRTGTKTLAALLGLSGNLFAYHEPRPKLFALSRLAYLYGDSSPADEILTAAFATARQELLEYALSCGRGYAETSPHLTFLAPAILRLLPNARFIHLTRHPVAVVRSGVRRRWYAGHHRDPTRITPRPGTEDADRWATYSVVQKNLWLWDATNRWILEFLSTLPPEQALCLKAEEIFAGDYETLKRLYAFAGAPMPSMRRVRSILRKRLNAQKKSAPPFSEADQADLRANLARFTAETASRLGYSLAQDG